MIYIAVLNNLIVNGSARFLNKLYANDVDIGSDVTISGKTTTGQLVIDGGTNFNNLGSGNSNNAPLVIGNSNGAHIAIDYDEIQQKTNATTAGDLWLNYGGGRVLLSTNGQIYAATNGTFVTPNLHVTNIGDNNNVASTAYIATGNITTLNTDQVNVENIDAENVDVKYNLKASHYDLQTVSQLGGVFRVAPSISIPSTVTPSTNVKTTSVTVTKSSSSATIEIVDNSIVNGNSQGDIQTETPYIGGITWASGAYVMCSGTIGDVVTGTMFGKITTINTNSRTLTLNITSGYDVLVAGTYSASQISGLTVVLYKNHSNYPVGIELNSYGTSVGRTYVDVYGGTSNEPSVRIGNVGGLTFNGATLKNQWGIYTDRGYFSGAIVSKEGNIGGFFIDQTNIHNNVTSLTDTSHTGIYLGTDGIRNYNTTGSKHVTIKDGTITANSVDLTGAIKATSGFIGQNATNGFTISNTAIYNPSTKSSLGSNTVDGVYVGKDGIALGKGVFKVTNAGAVTASNINATGGTIGGWSIGTDTNKSLYYGGTTPSATNLVLSKGTVANSTSVGGSTGSLSWMILAGNKFGVTTGGALYASEATISGAINATELNVGSASSSNHLIYNSTTGIIDLSTDWLKFNSNKTVMMGTGLTATSNQSISQMIIGNYNTLDNEAAFLIGGGSSASDTSNLFSITNIYDKNVTDTFVGDGSKTVFDLSNTKNGNPTLTIDGSSITISSHTNTSVTLSSAPSEGVVFTISYKTSSRKGYIILGNRSDTTNYGAYSITQGEPMVKATGLSTHAFGHVYRGNLIASGDGSLAHGYVSGSKVEASGRGSIIGGSFASSGTLADDFTNIKATQYGSAIQGFFNNTNVTSSGAGSFIVGYSTSGTVTASGSGSFIVGDFGGNTSRIASGAGSFIHMHSINSSLTASGIGSSIHGHSFNSSITASNEGATISGCIFDNSTVTASGKGSFIGGYTYRSSKIASGDGSFIGGSTGISGEMTASGNGSCVVGYTNTTMTASGNGSIALNESTIATGRASLVIGSFNSSDTS